MGSKRVKWYDRQKVDVADMNVQDDYLLNELRTSIADTFGDGVVQGLELQEDRSMISQVLGTLEDKTLTTAGPGSETVVQIFQATAGQLQEVIAKCKLDSGSAVGNLKARIYSLVTPTDPTSALNTLLSEKDVLINTLPTSATAEVSWDFTGLAVATAGALTVGDYYAIEFSKDSTLQTIAFNYSNANPYSGGHMRLYDGATTTVQLGWDLYFKVNSANIKVTAGDGFKIGAPIRVASDELKVEYANSAVGAVNYFAIKYVAVETDLEFNEQTGLFEYSRIEDSYEIVASTTKPAPDHAELLLLGNATNNGTSATTIVDERVLIPSNETVNYKKVIEITTQVSPTVRSFSGTMVNADGATTPLTYGDDYRIYKDDQDVVDDLGWTIITSGTPAIGEVKLDTSAKQITFNPNDIEAGNTVPFLYFKQLDTQEGLQTVDNLKVNGDLIIEEGTFTVLEKIIAGSLQVLGTFIATTLNGTYLLLNGLSSDPAAGSSTDGQFYYNTTTKRLRYFDGSTLTWKNVGEADPRGAIVISTQTELDQYWSDGSILPVGGDALARGFTIETITGGKLVTVAEGTPFFFKPCESGGRTIDGLMHYIIKAQVAFKSGCNVEKQSDLVRFTPDSDITYLRMVNETDMKVDRVNFDRFQDIFYERKSLRTGGDRFEVLSANSKKASGENIGDQHVVSAGDKLVAFSKNDQVSREYELTDVQKSIKELLDKENEILTTVPANIATDNFHGAYFSYNSIEYVIIAWVNAAQDTIGYVIHQLTDEGKLGQAVQKDDDGIIEAVVGFTSIAKLKLFTTTNRIHVIFECDDTTNPGIRHNWADITTPSSISFAASTGNQTSQVGNAAVNHDPAIYVREGVNADMLYAAYINNTSNYNISFRKSTDTTDPLANNGYTWDTLKVFNASPTDTNADSSVQIDIIAPDTTNLLISWGGKIENPDSSPGVAYTGGTDENLNNPDDTSGSTPANFVPCKGAINSWVKVGDYSWYISGAAGSSSTFAGQSTGTTYGSVIFMATSNWTVAGPEHDGIQTFTFAGAEGSFDYYFHSLAWWNAFAGQAVNVVIARNKSVYRGSISAANLVVTYDGIIGPAGLSKSLNILYSTDDATTWSKALANDAEAYQYQGGDVYQTGDNSKLLKVGSDIFAISNLNNTTEGRTNMIKSYKVTPSFLSGSLRDSWTSLTAPSGTAPRGYAWDNDDYIYALSADSSGIHLKRYSISSDTWETLSDFHSISSSAGQMVYDGKNHLYAIGANLSATQIYFKRYDILADEWTDLSVPLQSWTGTLSLQFPIAFEEGEVYLDIYTSTPFSSFQKYNINLDQWISLAPNAPTSGSYRLVSDGKYIYRQDVGDSVIKVYDIKYDRWFNATDWDVDLEVPTSGSSPAYISIDENFIYVCKSFTSNTRFFRYIKEQQIWQRLTISETSFPGIFINAQGNLYGMNGTSWERYNPYGDAVVSYSYPADLTWLDAKVNLKNEFPTDTTELVTSLATNSNKSYIESTILSITSAEKYHQIVVDNNNNPVIAWRDNTAGTLEVKWFDGKVWQSSLSNTLGTSDIGIKMIKDPKGNPTLITTAGASNYLQVWWWNFPGNSGTWTQMTANGSSKIFGNLNIQLTGNNHTEFDLAYDSQGNLIIAYVDPINNDTRIVVWDGNTTTQHIISSAQYGGVSIAIDDNDHIFVVVTSTTSVSVIDFTLEDLIFTTSIIEQSGGVTYNEPKAVINSDGLLALALRRNSGGFNSIRYYEAEVFPWAATGAPTFNPDFGLVDVFTLTGSPSYAYPDLINIHNGNPVIFFREVPGSPVTEIHMAIFDYNSWSDYTVMYDNNPTGGAGSYIDATLDLNGSILVNHRSVSGASNFSNVLWLSRTFLTGNTIDSNLLEWNQSVIARSQEPVKELIEKITKGFITNIFDSYLNSIFYVEEDIDLPSATSVDENYIGELIYNLRLYTKELIKGEFTDDLIVSNDIADEVILDFIINGNNVTWTKLMEISNAINSEKIRVKAIDYKGENGIEAGGKTLNVNLQPIIGKRNYFKNNVDKLINSNIFPDLHTQDDEYEWNEEIRRNIITLVDNASDIQMDDTYLYVLTSGTTDKCFIFDLKSFTQVAEFDGSASGSAFSSPTLITIDEEKIYIQDQTNLEITVWDKSSLPSTPSYLYKTSIPVTSYPAMDVDEDYLYLSDQANDLIRIYDKNTMQNVRTLSGSGGTSDGEFNNPYGIAIDGNRIYIADAVPNQRILWFDKKSFAFLGKITGIANSPTLLRIFEDRMYTANQSGTVLIYKKNDEGDFEFETTFPAKDLAATEPIAINKDFVVIPYTTQVYIFNNKINKNLSKAQNVNVLGFLNGVSSNGNGDFDS